jgi:hypothetical protein
MDQIITYKIRDTNTKMFSHGIILRDRRELSHTVRWSKKGKEWVSKKLLYAHLTKWVDTTGTLPGNWEIFELTYQTSSINEWIDANLLVKILTYQK